MGQIGESGSLAYSLGLTYPLKETKLAIGVLSSTNTVHKAAAANLQSLLITNWGERPMEYFLGCNLVEFIFEPKTPDLDKKIKNRITQAVAEQLPYIRIDDINISYSDTDVGNIYILVKFGLFNDVKNIVNNVSVTIRA